MDIIQRIDLDSSAWQPILTASAVIPVLFVFGIAFIPVGIGVLYFSNEVQEKIVEYTYCNSTDPMVSDTCASYIGGYKNLTCYCEVPFSLNSTFKAQVFVYYGLSNFYQNHRRYVKSRDDKQLLGRLKPDVNSDCSPYMYASYENDTKKPIAPCGAIANSMFSDELNISFDSSAGRINVPLIRTGIAWPSDKKQKFRNPPGDLKRAFEEFSKPIDWKKGIWELDPDDPTNNGLVNEDFIVWMRTAALPDFRKFYRLVDHTHPFFEEGLPRGDYVLNVAYSFPVTNFNGTKSLVIGTASVLGGKNVFLGILYIIVGCVLIILGIVFLVIHAKYGKSISQLVNVTPLTPYIVDLKQS